MDLTGRLLINKLSELKPHCITDYIYIHTCIYNHIQYIITNMFVFQLKTKNIQKLPRSEDWGL